MAAPKNFLLYFEKVNVMKKGNFTLGFKKSIFFVIPFLTTNTAFK